MSQLNGNNDLHSKSLEQLLVIIEKDVCTTKRVRAMEVALEKLTDNFNNAQLDVVDFIITISRLVMDSILDENIDIMPSIGENCDGSIQNKLKEHLLLGARILTVIKSLLDIVFHRKQLQIAELPSMPNNVLGVVNKTFSHCKFSKDLYKNHLNSLEELLELFKHAQDIHKKFFLILQSNVKFNLANKEDKKILLDVIDLIYDIILSTMGMNTKSMVETWKAFTNIISQYSQGLKFDLNIGKPLKIISNECLKTLCELDKTAVEENPNLKINKFYMKIAKHIFSAYWDQSKLSQVDSLDFFATLYSFTSPYAQSKEAVSGDLLKTIEEVYYSFIDECVMRFVREVDILQIEDLIAGLNERNQFGAIILILKIIEYSDALKDYTLLLYLNGVLQCLNSDSTVFSLDLQVYGHTLYEYLLLTFANKILCVNASEFQQIEELLVQHLLQGSASQTCFVHDLWILVLRKSPPNLSIDLIQQFIETSQLHHCKQSLLDRTLESTRLRLFMRDVYKNLPEESREFLFETYLPEESVAIWAVLGFENVPKAKIASAESTIQCVHKKINKLERGMFELEEFVYVINGLSVISSSLDCAVKSDFSAHVDYAMKLWNVEIEGISCNGGGGRLFSNFIFELCKLSARLIAAFDNTQLAHIMKQLEVLVRISPVTFKYPAVEFSLALCESNKTGRHLISPETARSFLEDRAALVKESAFAIVECLLAGGGKGGAVSWLRGALDEIRDPRGAARLTSNPAAMGDLRELQSLLNQMLN